MHPEIGKIFSKVGTSPWPQYMESVTLSGLRGWTGETVRFPFPVTVLCGPNGCGKSTVLKAAAAGYTNSIANTPSFAAGTFFPDTAWDHIQGAAITYNIRQGTTDKTYSIKKPTARWRLPSTRRPSRAVVWQDISRTLPIESIVGYSAIASRTATEISAQSLDIRYRVYYSSILGRQYSDVRFATSDRDVTRKVGVAQTGGLAFSQFHQGAGEDATMDLVLLLQNVPDTALVLIDEVEASLHPRSQRRLIHFLLWLARTKQIQVVLSTHSPFVLEELPEAARVYLHRTTSGIDVQYGVSSQYALSRMDDRERPELQLFCEDDETATIAQELLRLEGVDMIRVGCVTTGPADLVRAIGKLAYSGKLPGARGVLDADEAASDGCLVLPGNSAPEVQVFTDVKAHAASELATAVANTLGAVEHAMEIAMSEPDHHKWPAMLAKELGHQPPSFVWIAMVKIWVAHCVDPTARAQFATDVSNLLS